MKLLSFLLIAALSYSGSCDKDHSLLPRGQFVLEVNEKFDAGDFELLLSGISDSRCPKDVHCVWAGAAITTLAVQPPSGQDTLQLCLGDCRQVNRPFQEEDTDTLLVDGRQYAITLLEVNPYPGTGKSGQSKEAHFRLEPLP